MRLGRSCAGSLALPLASALCACAGTGTPEHGNGDPWPEVALAHAVDENPSPNVLEIELTASTAQKQFPGASKPSEVWAYNGTVPGPLLEAVRGSDVVVHFSNQLQDDTTIHWHGVRVPAAMDGNPMSPGPVPSGGRFDYGFTLKDAGLFWYHPHVRSDVQVERGLYGAILVHGDNEPKADHEAVLMLDDVDVLADGTFPEYLDDESKMMGREGKILLVNGVSQPTLPVRAGSLERLHLVNTANGRFFNLALSGQQLRIIGTDGGLVPTPYDADHVLIAPGERYDVMFVVDGQPGTAITLTDDPYDRGHDSGAAPPMIVATLRVSDAPELKGRVLPQTFPDIERLPAQPPDATLELGEAFQNGNLVFTINGKTFPDVPPIDVPDGAVRVLEVKNASEMDHPFHLHGFFFQLLSTDGVATAADRLANKDTLIVRKNSTVDLVARFDAPGDWMYHCHILEHAEGGMMGEVHVQ